MKLINHVLKIRSLVQQAIDNRFAKMGIKETGLVPVESLPKDLIPKREKLEDILNNHLAELQDYSKARRETINEYTFTLFNKIAAIKVMEEKELFPEVIKRRPENGNKSFAHNLWLEENPGEKTAERQGLKHFLQAKFNELGENFSLYNENYPYSLMPTADELYNILEAFNEVEDDPECGADVWKGDDILGWLYEDFNATEKEVLKNSDEKTEYDKVSLQSQVYTPRWVVKFLVDNTLGKFYMEMFPDSDLIKPDENGEVKYSIANAPSSKKREIKKLEDIRVIDPACGSGNFLIYAFDLLYDMYVNQIEQFGADYSRRDIPRLIIENNIYGVDLDERAVQLSQIALFIKAKEKGGRRAKNPSHTNVVSTHFSLPDYSEVKSVFEASGEWDAKQQETIKKIWSDLQNAYKFGSLVRIEEVLNGLSLKEDEGLLFAEEMSENLFSFKRRVTEVLREQVKTYCEKNSSEYALTKADDAMTFLSILSMPFDIVVANPPYTDSANFGSVLKGYIDDNYKKPLKFNTNLFAAFIKRSFELSGELGKVGMIHPHTFMFIKTFEDVRKFLIEKTHINLLVDYGLDRVNLFGPEILVEAALYTFEKGSLDTCDGVYFNITDNQQEKYKKDSLIKALDDYIHGTPNDRVYTLSQEKLKEIKTYPFIYWISDDFRKKFGRDTIEKSLANCQGLITSNNNRFLRYWWEVDVNSIGKDWIQYAKGGDFNKWYGNDWLTVNWRDNGYDIRNFVDENGKQRSRTQNERFYFREGVTYCSIGTKGTSYRILEPNHIFDSGGSSIFGEGKVSAYYLLGVLNTHLTGYIVKCLNPTVNTQVGDIGRIPIVIDPARVSTIEMLAKQCVEIKKELAGFSLIEINYSRSPISTTNTVAEEIFSYLAYENAKNTQILLIEAVLNSIVNNMYGLSKEDTEMVYQLKGKPVASLPVTQKAKERFLKWADTVHSSPLPLIVRDYIEALPIIAYSPSIDDFDTLYMTNNWWEDYCIKHNVNPIDCWNQFIEKHIIPTQRSQNIAFELLTDVIRTVLKKDDDGVIPVTDNAGEEKLSLRIEQEFNQRGYSNGQISQFIQVLGAPLDRFIKESFFDRLSNYLNLFMFLPKTPFIWHLSSGPLHTLDVFTSIYRWDRNTLFRIKSVYIANRESFLKDKMGALSNEDGMSQHEIGAIREQLVELKSFETKIDSLLSSGYNPILNDGVGKNIAPLQHLGILSSDVLNANQLDKYLHADW